MATTTTARTTTTTMMMTTATTTASRARLASRAGRPRVARPARDRAAAVERRARRSTTTRADATSASTSASSDDDGLASMLALMRDKSAARRAEASTSASATKAARVYLVGTGPGDPGLLTLRAYQLMQTADVVLYDRLVSNDILNLVREEARMVYVGKRAGFHTRTQDEIHELLLAFADAGATILRLKGGDPLVFGRGGEEFEFLRENNPNVRVEVVPGITAAAGVASALGVPLTHRGVATSVRLLTGHLREGAGTAVESDGASSLSPKTASDPVEFAVTSADVETTLVVYMGLGTLPRLAERLLESGFPASMPAVAIERGTTADERRVFSSLASLPDAAAARALVSPTLIVVGRTVALSPLWPYAADAETRGLDAYEPSKWTEQRGSPRASEDADDWKAWLSASVDFSAPTPTPRDIHADSAF